MDRKSLYVLAGLVVLVGAIWGLSSNRSVNDSDSQPAAVAAPVQPSLTLQVLKSVEGVPAQPVVFHKGTNYIIRWTAVGFKPGESVSIALYQAGRTAPVYTIASGVAFDSAYNWVVPVITKATSASGYKVRISKTNDPNVFDESNVPISIK